MLKWFNYCAQLCHKRLLAYCESVMQRTFYRKEQMGVNVHFNEKKHLGGFFIRGTRRENLWCTYCVTRQTSCAVAVLFRFERTGEGFSCSRCALSARPLEDSPPWNIQRGRRPRLKHRWSDTSRASDVWRSLRARLELRKKYRHGKKKKTRQQRMRFIKRGEISCRHPSKSFLRQMKGWIRTWCDAASFLRCHFSLSASPTSPIRALH